MSTSMLLLSLAPYSHSMSTFRDLRHDGTFNMKNCSSWRQCAEWRECEDVPVIGDVELEMSDVRCIFRQNDVASELARGEPEGKVWNIVELEFCVNPAEVKRTSQQTLNFEIRQFLYLLMLHYSHVGGCFENSSTSARLMVKAPRDVITTV